jgi:acetylglutamate kinase
MTEPLVVKLGGDVVADPSVLNNLLTDVASYVRTGNRVVMIHGGGPQATALTRRLGLEAIMVGGRRITSPETLEVMKMTLGGSVSVDLAAACRAVGLPGVAVSGVSVGLVNAVKRPARIVSGCGPDPVDFGEVGDVKSVNVAAIHALLDAGFVPIISSLAATDEGRVLNINGDIVACDVAIALNAACLILLTAVDGVFEDLSNPTTRLAHLRVAEARALIDSDTVHGGMIPKLEESFRALKAGVGKVRICAVGHPHVISHALEDVFDFGTTLVA